MHFVRLRESLGFLSGLGLGVLTGAGSLLRHSRVLHPRGITAIGKITSPNRKLAIPRFVLLRFSSAIWKNHDWPDVLGIALRFSNSENFTEVSKKGDQDLLFATIRHPITMPFAPFATNVKDYLSNIYYAVSPFTAKIRGQKMNVKFRLVPIKESPTKQSRNKRLQKALIEQKVEMELQYINLDQKNSDWTEAARIQVKGLKRLDQEKLKFNPFLTGAGIHPRGFVNFLRKGAYRASQKMRPRRATEKRKTVEKNLNS